MTSMWWIFASDSMMWRFAADNPTTLSCMMRRARPIPFDMGNSHPGDHLQIAWKLNGLFVNMSVGTVQNFS